MSKARKGPNYPLAELRLRAMSCVGARERKFIASWLRDRAESLEKWGDEYCDNARFVYWEVRGRIPNKPGGVPEEELELHSREDGQLYWRHEHKKPPVPTPWYHTRSGSWLLDSVALAVGVAVLCYFLWSMGVGRH